MRLLISGSLILLSLWLIAGCASTFKTEPESEASVLVVGNLELKATGYSGYNQSFVNGTTTSGIKLTFYNYSSGNRIQTTTFGTSGQFYFKAKPNTRYHLSGLFIKITGNNEAWVSVRGTNTNLQFETQQGAVYNLGKFLWSVDKNAEITNDLNSLQQWQEVESGFRKRYQKSEWLNREWKNL